MRLFTLNDQSEYFGNIIFVRKITDDDDFVEDINFHSTR